MQVPSPDTQCGQLLRAFERGERLTVLDALTRYGVYALSQRVGNLRRAGWPIESKMVTVPSGKHVAEYWMEL